MTYGLYFGQPFVDLIHVLPLPHDVKGQGNIHVGVTSVTLCMS